MNLTISYHSIEEFANLIPYFHLNCTHATLDCDYIFRSIRGAIDVRVDIGVNHPLFEEGFSHKPVFIRTINLNHDIHRYFRTTDEVLYRLMDYFHITNEPYDYLSKYKCDNINWKKEGF